MIDYNDSIDISEESEESVIGEQSIKQIILRQIKKIGDICSKEFTGGYWEDKPIKVQGGMFLIKQYHEDVREAYCVAVDFIIDLVYAMSDNEFKKLVDEDNARETLDIKEKLKYKRKLFRELNNMFFRTNFFDTSIVVNR